MNVDDMPDALLGFFKSLRSPAVEVPCTCGGWVYFCFDGRGVVAHVAGKRSTGSCVSVWAAEAASQLDRVHRESAGGGR